MSENENGEQPTEEDSYPFSRIEEGAQRPKCISCGDPAKIVFHSGGVPMAAEHCREYYAELRFGKIPKYRRKRRGQELCAVGRKVRHRAATSKEPGRYRHSVLTGPQRHLVESVDSEFLYKRNDIIRLKQKLERLQRDLEQADVAPDLRDLVSDKDRTGGKIYIAQAIARTKKAIATAQKELDNLGDNWNRILQARLPKGTQEVPRKNKTQTQLNGRAPRCHREDAGSTPVVCLGVQMDGYSFYLVLLVVLAVLIFGGRAIQKLLKKADVDLSDEQLDAVTKAVSDAVAEVEKINKALVDNGEEPLSKEEQLDVATKLAKDFALAAGVSQVKVDFLLKLMDAALEKTKK